MCHALYFRVPGLLLPSSKRAKNINIWNWNICFPMTLLNEIDFNSMLHSILINNKIKRLSPFLGYTPLIYMHNDFQSISLHGCIGYPKNHLPIPRFHSDFCQTLLRRIPILSSGMFWPCKLAICYKINIDDIRRLVKPVCMLQLQILGMLSRGTESFQRFFRKK